ncbi:hypothetical protein KUTeg_021365 [Tegillarca granosa]|uniref:Rieske domain-containing protein n=1 Tax=Tegillarca granosa TaxID=220873 RepID=A0ABQ9EAM0_TEGGR|nr:hypothetical protein KUTeg_021365 [Tegillarca granosa]
MISFPKNQFISATAQIVPNILRPVVYCVPGAVNKSEIVVQRDRQSLRSCSLTKSNITHAPSVTSGIGSKLSRPSLYKGQETECVRHLWYLGGNKLNARNLKQRTVMEVCNEKSCISKMCSFSNITVKTQIRFTHSDVMFPNKNMYRKDGTKDVTKTEDMTPSKAYRYLILGGGAVGGAYFAQKLVRAGIGSLSMTNDVLALGKTEIDLSEIPEGKGLTFKWRGKPLFVKHRTAEEIETEAKVDLSTLRDPQHDADRAKKPEWLVVIGICTHLGCIPIADAGLYGGYFCPCHGSHYDGSGRIRKGPAPLNLEVPYYSFTDDNKMIVG